MTQQTLTRSTSTRTISDSTDGEATFRGPGMTSWLELSDSSDANIDESISQKTVLHTGHLMEPSSDVYDLTKIQEKKNWCQIGPNCNTSWKRLDSVW